MINVPQPQLYPVRPSPLAGFGEAVTTLADAVIKGREKAAVLSDYDLLPQILDQVQQLDQPQTGGGEGGGDPYTQADYGEAAYTGGPEASGPADTGNTLKDTLAKMKTTQGKVAAIKLMLEHGPKPVYTSEGEFAGHVGADAKFLPKPTADSTTSVYDPKSGKIIQVPGKFAQIKTESETPAEWVTRRRLPTSSVLPADI